MDDVKISLKSTVLIYQLNAKSVTLRFCSEIIKIDDDYGDINFFFSLLDGRYSQKQILSIFADKYPDNANKALSCLETADELCLPAPALSALVSVATGVMVCEAIKILTGIQPPSLTNKLGSFSFDNLTISVSEEWKLNPECPCCRTILN